MLFTFKLAFAVATTTRKCRRGSLITGQLFICLLIGVNKPNKIKPYMGHKWL